MVISEPQRMPSYPAIHANLRLLINRNATLPYLLFFVPYFLFAPLNLFLNLNLKFPAFHFSVRPHGRTFAAKLRTGYG
jgi:hypothetical protein